MADSQADPYSIQGWLFCKSALSSGENRAKPRLKEDTGNYVTLIALNLDPSLLDRSTCAANFLDLLCERFLFRLAYPDEPCEYRHGFSTTVRRLPNNIHASAVLLGRGGHASILITSPTVE